MFGSVFIHIYIFGSVLSIYFEILRADFINRSLYFALIPLELAATDVKHTTRIHLERTIQNMK